MELVIGMLIVVAMVVAFGLVMDMGPGGDKARPLWKRARDYGLIAVLLLAGGLLLQASGCRLGPEPNYYGEP